MLNKKILITLSTAFVCGTHPAFATEDEQARRAILELRSALKQSDMVRNGLAQQVQQLQREVTQLRGQIESLGFVTNSPTLEARANDAMGVSAQVGDPAEQHNYDAALDLFRQNNYAGAAKALANFIANYPYSVLTPNALFYEGSSRYASRDFKGAIATLTELTTHYPNDSKAGDALLVIAGSQLELNDIAASKATLVNTVKQYPGTPAADTAAERLKMY